MKTFNYKDDYFKALLEGEGETISWAEAVAIHSLKEYGTNGNCLIVRFDETDAEGNPDSSLFSLYRLFAIKGKYFSIQSSEERLAHGLSEILSQQYMEFASSEKSSSWWSSLIIENEDGSLSLSDLCKELKMPVCDEIKVPFIEFINELEKRISRWKIIATLNFDSIVLSSSSPVYSSLPVRFAIQEVFDCPVFVLENVSLEDLDYSRYMNNCFLAKNLLEEEFCINPKLSVCDVLSSGSIGFMTPVGDDFKAVPILGSIKLGDLYENIPEPDFTVSDIPLKRINLNVTKTGYGTVVISAEDGKRIMVGVPYKNAELSIILRSSGSDETESTLPKKKASRDEGLRLHGYSIDCNTPSYNALLQMSEEKLLAEKERITSVLNFDIITPDTNIFLRTRKNAEGFTSMFYAGMLYSLSRLQKSKNTSSCGFEVNSAVQEELYRFQCGKSHDNDSAWERSKNCNSWRDKEDKISLKINARNAIRMLDKLSSDNMVCSSPDILPVDGNIYADPFIVKRSMEIISQGKSLLLISDDTDLRCKVKVEAQRYCASHPEAKKPAVMKGEQVLALTSCLHKIDEELSARSASLAS